MGVFTYEFEVATQFAPATLFKALVLDRVKVFPKAIPQLFKKFEIISGNGGPGTIVRAHLIGQADQVNKIEVLDTQKLEFSFTIVEGDDLKDSIEKITHHFKIVEGPNGGSVVKTTVKYFTKGDSKPKEEYTTESKARYTGIYKAVENHLLASLQAN